MRTGDIILVPFPFAELTNKKVRPSVVIAETKDKYRDIIVSAISSVVPASATENEIIIVPSSINKLRAKSVIKVDRIVTVKREDMIAPLGKLTESELAMFKQKFKALVEEK
ncbi:MAG: type II toxin-antitoxin system PemK/MazF family toxin [Bacteroidota bacterium]